MAERIGGIIFVKANGQQYKAKGNWTYNLGRGMREGVAGNDGVHGFTEQPQVPFIEGTITDSAEISHIDLVELRDVTITLELANGKVVTLEEAWFAGEGEGSTEAGEISARFEGVDADEVL